MITLEDFITRCEANAVDDSMINYDDIPASTDEELAKFRPAHPEYFSHTLSDERLKEIDAFPITFDDDLPECTDEELSRFRPAHLEYFEAKTSNDAAHHKELVEA